MDFSHECILLFYVYNMHQDMKSARLIAVYKRSYKLVYSEVYYFSSIYYRARVVTALLVLQHCWWNSGWYNTVSWLNNVVERTMLFIVVPTTLFSIE